MFTLFVEHVLYKENLPSGYPSNVVFLCVLVCTAFRLGKSIDMLQGAVKATSIKDNTIRSLVILNRLSRSIFLMYDMFAWAAKTSIITSDAKIWSRRSAIFWFWAVAFCLLRDMYELRLWLRKSSDEKEKKRLKNQLVVDLWKNISDMIIILNMLEKINVSQGTVGICGILSSVAGMLELLYPQYKLTPA